MTAKIHYSDEQLKLYIQEYNSGNSLTAICDKYKLNRHILSRELKEHGITISRRKFKCNENIFENINENTAYWLGFIAADGCVTATNNREKPSVLSFNLNIRDKNHLEKFKNFINSDAIIKEQKGVGYGIGTIIAHLEINSIKLVSDLGKYGICKAKSNILKPPNIPEEFYKDWIRGYLDGDGSISLLHNGQIQIAFEGTKEVLNFITQFFEPGKERKLGKRYKEKNNNNFHISFGGTQQPLTFLHLLYDNAYYYLDRKYQKILEIYSRFEK